VVVAVGVHGELQAVYYSVVAAWAWCYTAEACTFLLVAVVVVVVA